MVRLLSYRDFNTSYVTVQLCYYFLCFFISIISIHPMLRFNKAQDLNYLLIFLISIHPMLRFNFKGIRYGCLFINFNTSYVTVQPIWKFLKLLLVFNFNTSYVTVQLPLGIERRASVRNFNTSYVTVQLKKTENYRHVFRFQYILCYGSTGVEDLKKARWYHFNTSYVTVQRLLALLGLDISLLFQYILCYGSTSCK